MKYWQRAKTPLFCYFIGLVLVQIGFTEICLAQKFTFSGNRKKEAMDFKLIKNLIVIPLYINEKGPFNFILDTGVGSLIVTDPALLDTLKLSDLRPTKVYGLGQGQEIEAFRSNEIDIRIQSAVIKNMPAALLKEDIFDLSNYLGVKIYGLIGYHFFNSFVVKINYVSNRINYALPQTSFKKTGEKLKIEIENNRPYVFADIKTDDDRTLKVKLIIDCGASHALSMDALDGKAFPLPKDTISANLGVGLSGIINGSIGRVQSLNLGGFIFEKVLSGFPDFEVRAAKIGFSQQNGNLGADVLRRFKLIFDYQHGFLYLKPNQNYGDPFEHDMSGIEVYGNTDRKRVFIGRIEHQSPAEKAGLLEQDELIAINFKPVREYSLEEIGKLFKSQDGRTMLVEVMRDEKHIVKLFKLKRRI